jgi:hypothetical protein
MNMKKAYLGLDFGKDYDYSAMTIIVEDYYLGPKGWLSAAQLSDQEHDRPEDREEKAALRDIWWNNYEIDEGLGIYGFRARIHFIHKWPKNTSYTQVLEDVLRIIHKLGEDKVLVAADYNSVGNAVIETLKDQTYAPVTKVVTTGGVNSKSGYMRATVPKWELVQQLYLAISSDPPLLVVEPATKLIQEFQQQARNLQKIQKAYADSITTYDPATHDDLVFSTAFAVHIWFRDRQVKLLKSNTYDEDGRIQQQAEGLSKTELLYALNN